MSSTDIWWTAVHVTRRWHFDRKVTLAACRDDYSDAVKFRALMLCDVDAAASSDQASEFRTLCEEVDDPQNQNRALSVSELFGLCCGVLDETPEALVARLEGQRAA